MSRWFNLAAVFIRVSTFIPQREVYTDNHNQSLDSCSYYIPESYVPDVNVLQTGAKSTSFYIRYE